MLLRIKIARLFLSLVIFGYFSSGAAGLAQERALSTEEFEDASLQYRTALHYDSLLAPPLDGLITLYREAERIDELIGTYQSHTEKYPDDAGAKAVLIQILNRENREEAGELVTSSVALHPSSAALQYLLFQFLEGRGDERALTALSTAIDLEVNGARRAQWLEELLQLSEGEEGRALATVQLKKLLDLEGQSASDLLSLAKLMQRFLFWDLSLGALEKANRAGLNPDGEVDATFMEAIALREEGDLEEAGALLETLLSRLASDHWRRREVLTTRYSVIATNEERAQILDRFRSEHEENPENESAVIDYAELLVASERQSEAVEVILSAAITLPRSEAIESRALELLDAGNNPLAKERFLEERLEIDPERSDLRFRLVKTRYLLGKEAEAEQDFSVVVAGLEPEAVGERILELQRYLRTIDRLDAAAHYLEDYVRRNPDRLSVARELAEIYLARDQAAAINPLVESLKIDQASSDEIADLSGFLIQEGFLESAQVLLVQRIKAVPESFDLGLMLVEVYGELGDEGQVATFSSRMRELADTPERYSRWIASAVVANTKLESLDRFYANEQVRFSFDDGEWAAEKVEKFILLCESGGQRLQLDLVASTVRDQLQQGTFDSSLKIRLRKFLVGMLSSDPAASTEVEEQLKALAQEDAVNRSEYDMQRALLYQRTQRIDLAQSMITESNFSEIRSPQILQEAVEVMINYGFLQEATEALKVVNELLPEDVFSWERRLTLLASLNQESEFRSVVRSLRSGDAGVELRSDSLAKLDEHLQASFWRSVSRNIATGNANRFEETLPLLASVDREDQSLTQASWTEWTRALILSILGREEESKAALDRLTELVFEKDIESIEFPDGLSLSPAGAASLVTEIRQAQGAPSVLPLMPQISGSALAWAFEIEPGLQIEQFGKSDSEILVMDNRGTVSSIDQVSGKLLWRERFGGPFGSVASARPGLFISRPNFLEEAETEVKTVRPFLVEGDRFFLYAANAVTSFAARTGELLWSAEIPDSHSDAKVARMGARPEAVLDVGDGIVVLFRPGEGRLFAFEMLSGKQIWERTISNDSPAGTLSSLNAGVDVRDGRVFAYGWHSLVLDAKTGLTLWEFDRALAATFPVTLRQERGAELAEAMQRDTPSAPLQLLDFTHSSRSSVPLSSLEKERLSLVSPAVYWTRNRLLNSVASYGVMADGFLWLMQEGALRRLSLRLPVASRKLEAQGTFLGVVKNHAWLLEGETLHHLDFNTDRTSQLDLRELGSNLRAVHSGNQIVVRGPTGAKVINALTGNLLGSYSFPPEVLRHVKVVAETEAYQARPLSLWRGRSYLPENGEPRYCLPIRDLVSENGYVTQFGRNVLVCLRPAKTEVSLAQEMDSVRP